MRFDDYYVHNIAISSVKTSWKRRVHACVERGSVCDMMEKTQSRDWRDRVGVICCVRDMRRGEGRQGETMIQIQHVT